MLNRFSTLLMFALLATVLVVSGNAFDVFGQDKAAQSQKASDRKPKTEKPVRTAPTEITAQQERDAIAFAKEHHEELANLLKRLKGMDESAYKSAIAELSRAAERINRMKERSPERYKFDLRRWQLDSQIRLMAARSTMSGNLAQSEELTGLLKQRYDLQVEQLRAERKRLQDRLDRIDEQLAAKSENADKAIAAELKRLQTSISAKWSSKKNDKKPKQPVKKRPSKPTSK